jgi:hypothetical protein
MIQPITDPFILKPRLTWDGKPWVQRCFVCTKEVNYQKTSPVERVRVGDLVRHKKCRPKEAV